MLFVNTEANLKPFYEYCGKEIANFHSLFLLKTQIWSQVLQYRESYIGCILQNIYLLIV